jgi:NitT/TauT family transport system ATP-binding protein
MKGMPKAKAERLAMDWLDVVGLTRFADHYPAQLSGGMKQRVAIARALANEPRILLMDEPFGALDAQTRCQMQSHLLQIWHNVDVTVLFITHDLDEAIYLADRIVVLAARPGHVKEIIDVPLPRPRTREMFLDPYFLATKARLEDLIHPPAQEQDERLPLLRMTLVGDDVL